MTMRISNFNALDDVDAFTTLSGCNASEVWADRLIKKRPFETVQALQKAAADIWSDLREEDYLQAFDGHPKIGDPDSLKKRYAATHTLAKNEQSGVDVASDSVIQELATQNQTYLDKFGFIFIVCATGKSATEMLNLLKQRLPNSRVQEIHVAAQEQRKITEIRIKQIFE